MTASGPTYGAVELHLRRWALCPKQSECVGRRRHTPTIAGVACPERPEPQLRAMTAAANLADAKFGIQGHV